MSVKTITKDNFNAEVISSEKPVVVEFWASMCPFCRILSPVLDRLSGKLDDSVSIGKVNVDEQPELEAKFDVTIVPTLFLFQNGKPGEKLVAPLSQSKIEDWIKTQMNS